MFMGFAYFVLYSNLSPSLLYTKDGTRQGFGHVKKWKLVEAYVQCRLLCPSCS